MAAQFERRVHRGFRQVVLAYVLIGAVWMIVTEYQLSLQYEFTTQALLSEVGKGLVFISITALTLHFFLMRLKARLVLAVVGESEAKEKLAAIIDSPLVGIAVWDSDGTVVEANDTLASMLGVLRRDLLERKVKVDVLVPVHPWQNLGDKPERSEVFSTELARQADNPLPVLAGINSLGDDSAAGILFFIDDTERREAIEEREKTLLHLEDTVATRTRQLTVSNKNLEAFAYSISHDLQAPLRSIDGMTAMMEADLAKDSKDGLRAAGRIHHNVSRMQGIIDSLLRLAQVSRNPLVTEPIDLSDMAQLTIDDLLESTPTRKVAVSIEPGLAVLGDRQLLRVVVRNLLENSWKFTSGRTDARISVFRDNDCIVFEDNGFGFDPDLAATLFKPFTRSSDAESVEGSGIGLAIVQRIVEGHGWTIDAIGTPDEGAQFRINLHQRPNSGTSNAHNSV